MPASGQQEGRKTVSDSSNERMEVKNSGIPGPSAISWKRKSAEDSPVEGKKTKKRKVINNEETDDPYSFNDESKTVSKEDSKKVNGNVSNRGYKYKSALLAREHDVDSDESSLSGGASRSEAGTVPG